MDNSNQRSQSPANKTSTSPSDPSKLPQWAQAAMKEETRAQLWKDHTKTENVVDYAQGEDILTFTDKDTDACIGECSLAA